MYSSCSGGDVYSLLMSRAEDGTRETRWVGIAASSVWNDHALIFDQGQKKKKKKEGKLRGIFYGFFLPCSLVILNQEKKLKSGTSEIIASMLISFAKQLPIIIIISYKKSRLLHVIWNSLFY